MHIGHFKGDSPSDLNAAEAAGGGTLYFCSDEEATAESFHSTSIA